MSFINYISKEVGVAVINLPIGIVIVVVFSSADFPRTRTEAIDG
jgi:hypothetical protein